MILNSKKLNQFRELITHHPIYLKYSLIIIPGVCIGVALIGIGLITIPQILKLFSVSKQISEVKNKQTVYQTKISELDKVDLAEYKDNLNRSLAILPADKDIPGAIEVILNVISSAGLQLENVSLGSTTQVPGVETIGFKLDVTGSIEQLKNLIQLADQSPKPVKIASIIIGNSSLKGTSATVEMLTFYSPVKSTSASTDVPLSQLTLDEQKALDLIKTNVSSDFGDENDLNIKTGKKNPFN